MRLTRNDVKNEDVINFIKSGNSISQAAYHFGCSVALVRLIQKGERSTRVQLIDLPPKEELEKKAKKLGSLAKVARHYGVHPDRIYHMFRPSRAKKHSRKLPGSDEKKPLKMCHCCGLHPVFVGVHDGRQIENHLLCRDCYLR